MGSWANDWRSLEDHSMPLRNTKKTNITCMYKSLIHVYLDCLVVTIDLGDWGGIVNASYMTLKLTTKCSLWRT